MNTTSKAEDATGPNKVAIGVGIAVPLMLIVAVAVILLVITWKRKKSQAMAQKTELQREDSVYSAVMFSGGKTVYQGPVIIRNMSYTSIRSVQTKDSEEKEETAIGDSEMDHQYFVLEKSAGDSVQSVPCPVENGRNTSSTDSGYFTLQVLTTSGIESASGIESTSGIESDHDTSSVSSKRQRSLENDKEQQTTTIEHSKVTDEVVEYENTGYYENEAGIFPVNQENNQNSSHEIYYNEKVDCDEIYVNESFQAEDVSYANYVEKDSSDDDKVSEHTYDHTRDILQETKDYYDHIVRN